MNNSDYASEFGSAAAIAGKIRRTFFDFLPCISDTTYFNRLVALLTLIGKTDFNSGPGLRHPFSGNCFLLEDFQWNAKHHLSKALNTEYHSWIDAASGNMLLELEPFVPLTAVTPPAGASHFQVLARGINIHPKQMRLVPCTTASSVYSTADTAKTDMISLPLKVSGNDKPGLFLLCAAVIFYEDEAGVLSAVRGGAAAIATVENVLYGQDAVSIDDLSEPIAASHPIPPRDRAWLLEEILKKVEAEHKQTNALPGPVLDDPLEQARRREAFRKLKRAKWLKRLDQYRYGK